MFHNIGEKIKILATIMTILGIIASVISGIAFIVYSIVEAYDVSGLVAGIILGVLTMVVGSLLSWISSFLLYGYGELIENSTIIKEKLADKE